MLDKLMEKGINPIISLDCGKFIITLGLTKTDPEVLAAHKLLGWEKPAAICFSMKDGSYGAISSLSQLTFDELLSIFKAEARQMTLTHGTANIDQKAELQRYKDILGSQGFSVDFDAFEWAFDSIHRPDLEADGWEKFAGRNIDGKTLIMGYRRKRPDVRPLILTTFFELQKEVSEWSTHNFGEGPAWHKLLGCVEELGELAHAELKMAQGIRTNENHVEKGKDAVGDLLIYLADFCVRRNWDLQDIIQKTWAKVKQRDWKKDPVKGGET